MEENTLAIHNVNIIDISPIIDTTYKKYYRYITENNFEEVGKRVTEKLFMNFFIIEICEMLKSLKTNRVSVLFYNKNHLPGTNNINFYKIIHKSLKNLPVKYIINDNNVETFKNLIVNDDIDAVSGLEIAKNKNKPELSKLRLFLKRNDLCYLYNTYFKQASNKIIAIK